MTGYRVIVDIPDMAPEGTGEAVFDIVADACANLEDTHPELRSGDGWDLGVSGGPSDITTETELRSALVMKIEQHVNLLVRVKTLADMWGNASPALLAEAAKASAAGDDSLTEGTSIGLRYATALRAALDEPT